jgi:hypothetical protein
MGTLHEDLPTLKTFFLIFSGPAARLGLWFPRA